MRVGASRPQATPSSRTTDPDPNPNPNPNPDPNPDPNQEHELDGLSDEEGFDEEAEMEAYQVEAVEA